MSAPTTAQHAKITDEAIEILRREIGVKSTMPQYNRVATDDAIRHYALGIGDDNPRWVDPDYAGSSVGGAVAPATFVFTSGWPRSRGMPGVHGLFTGVDLVCHRPVPVGARISVTTELDQVIERQGRYAGREVQQVYKTVYSGEDGQPYSTLYSHAFRTERSTGGKSEKFASIQPQVYDDASLRAIGELYRQEKKARRGATPRYFEDVEIGQEMSPIVKGPLTITDCICFLMGFGYIYVKAHRQWYEWLQRHPGGGVKNKYGIWDVPERVHWEHDFAREIGMPAGYDYGPQRIAWFDHAVSDWMGDHGHIRSLGVQLRAPNFIGDTTYIRGSVVSKSEDEGTVSLEMIAEDQRGRMTAKGKSEVALPRKA